MRCRCGEKYDMSLVTNLLLSPTVKEFWKSFNINQSNKWSNGTFLWPRVQIHTYFTLLTSLAIQMSTFNQMFKLTPQEAFIDKYVTFSTFYFSFIHLWYKFCVAWESTLISPLHSIYIYIYYSTPSLQTNVWKDNLHHTKN